MQARQHSCLKRETTWLCQRFTGGNELCNWSPCYRSSECPVHKAVQLCFVDFFTARQKQSQNRCKNVTNIADLITFSQLDHSDTSPEIWDYIYMPHPQNQTTVWMSVPLYQLVEQVVQHFQCTVQRCTVLLAAEHNEMHAQMMFFLMMSCLVMSRLLCDNMCIHKGPN